MGISLKKSANHTIINIHAVKLNGYLVPTLRKTLMDLIHHNQVNIIINMSTVSSIDSDVLGCLISTQKKCINRGGQISICGLQPDILMIFYIIKLDEYIYLYNNEFDALNSQNILTRRRLKLIKG